MKIKWYTHSDYNSAEITWQLTKIKVPDGIKDKLAEEIRNHFDEVEFDVEINDKTGEIVKIEKV